MQDHEVSKVLYLRFQTIFTIIIYYFNFSVLKELK